MSNNLKHAHKASTVVLALFDIAAHAHIVLVVGMELGRWVRRMGPDERGGGQAEGQHVAVASSTHPPVAEIRFCVHPPSSVH